MTIDRIEIYRLLNLPPRGLAIVGVQVLAWGEQLTIDCLYDPDEQSKHFKMIFETCQQITWEIYGNTKDKYADVISISLGKNQYREAAVIHTDIFEVTVLYGEVTLCMG